MNIRTFNCSTAILLIWVATGPSSAQSDEPDVLVPLAVGNSWTFEETVLDKTGALKKKRKSFAKVLDAKKLGEHVWYKYREFGDDFWVRQGANGQYEAEVFGDGDALQLENQFLFYRFPVKRTPQTYKTDLATIQVIAVDQKVMTPAGTFSCYVYRLSEPELTIQMYVSPGIGLVKNRFEDESEIQIRELTAYKLR